MSTVVYLRGSHFEMMTQVGLLSCAGCGSGTFKESLAITTAPDPASDIRQVVIRARRTGAHPGTFGAVYRWDKAAGKFVTVSHELERLDEFNQMNY